MIKIISVITIAAGLAGCGEQPQALMSSKQTAHPIPAPANPMFSPTGSRETGPVGSRN